MTNPRFRTMHDAGKYVSALALTSARKMDPTKFGAIVPSIINPAYASAQFEVSNYGGHLHINDLFEDTQSMAEWYNDSGLTIVFADHSPKGQEFIDFWYYTPVTNDNFIDFISKCITD